MISSMGSHPNLVNSFTELSENLASSINRAHRFWILSILIKFSLERLPQTVQQYSRIDLKIALYNIFLQ